MLDVDYSRNLIEQYRPLDDDDTSFKSQFLAFFKTVDLMGVAPHGRLTGAAWVVDKTHKKVLLLYNNFLKLWMNPGGKYEAGDIIPEGTAARELTEETSIMLESKTFTLFDIDVIDMAYNPNLPTNFYDMRFLAVVDSTAFTLNGNAQWFDLPTARATLRNDVRNRRLLQRTEILFA